MGCHTGDRRHGARLARPATGAVAFLLVALLQSASQGAPAATAVESLTATLRSVDLKTHTLEVVTGIGNALRVVRIACHEGTPITRRGDPVGLEGLARGDLVHVDFEREGDTCVASEIEVLPAPGARVGR